jgi:uncharacterized cupin superfamily protein
MKRKMERPSFIVSRAAIEAPAAPPHASEDFGFASELSAATGLNHFRVAHLRIPPGRRGYPPMAMDDLEIFAFVLEGQPDLWVDGHIHALTEGDGIALHAATGLAHTLINNSKRDVRIFVMTEAFRRNSRAVHPGDDAANENLKKMGMFWPDAPKHKLGPNDGRPGTKSGRDSGKPKYVTHWRKILEKDKGGYPNSAERHCIDAPFGRHARYTRIGIRFQILKPGRRASFPHAERDEDEFVYVVSGKVDAWNDGAITPMAEGDFIGWRAGNGVTHTIINNSKADALLLVGGEASRMRAQIWYPLHPHRDKETGDAFWFDHPKVKLGPHDGLPDALRARLPKAKRRPAIAANKAAMSIDPKKK